nr:glycerophosphodiester phosphodiesterase family protein [uncultured Capnocytophaga sp.]
MKKTFLLSLLLLLGVVACKNSSTGQITPEKDVITNQIYFAEKPIVSAHRAGKGIAGYPENCLQTIQYLSKKGIHSFEIDIFESADGDLMLMHDDKLGRTATGQGVVSQMTTEALLKERLKDDFGKETDFQIPLLKDVLAWCKQHGAYLMLDFKKGISYKKVAELVRAEQMQAQVVLISYNVEQAKALYRVAPEMLISVTIRNQSELDRILETGIEREKLVAFTGVHLADDSLYKKLNELRIPSILGTLGNLDKRAEARGDHLYKEWAQKGIQIFSTDRPFAPKF